MLKDDPARVKKPPNQTLSKEDSAVLLKSKKKEKFEDTARSEE